MIITIDGPSGTGKSTVARGVAKKLGFIFFDTGAMYRAVAWKLIQEGLSVSQEQEIEKLLPRFKFEIRRGAKDDIRYFVDEKDVSQEIRTPEIATLASQVAVLPQVRKALGAIQKRFSYRQNSVFEGRDMGTEVFPHADVKIFLTARPEIRAERRYRELVLKFPDLAESFSQDQVLADLQDRDSKDSSRAISPLRPAEDAVILDTSFLSVIQVIERIAAIFSAKVRVKKFSPMRGWYWFVYFSVRCFCKLFYRMEVYGIEHFYSGAAIIAANHVSYLDPIVISVSCPEEVHFLARESLFKVPLLGKLIRSLNSYPVSRESSDTQTFRKLIHLLQEGNKIILFPEGRRSEDGQLQPLERGLSFLASKASCGVIPTYVDGTGRLWNRSRSFPRLFGKVRCVFGSPIEWAEFEGLDKKEAMLLVTERTRTALVELKNWLEKGARGTPP